MTVPKRIDPPGCGCTDCLTDRSEPLCEWGDDEQFSALVHAKTENATGCDLGDLHHVLDQDGRERFGRFLWTELGAGRLVSRPRIESKSLEHLLGDLFD